MNWLLWNMTSPLGLGICVFSAQLKWFNQTLDKRATRQKSGCNTSDLIPPRQQRPLPQFARTCPFPDGAPGRIWWVIPIKTMGAEILASATNIRSRWIKTVSVSQHTRTLRKLPNLRTEPPLRKEFSDICLKRKSYVWSCDGTLKSPDPSAASSHALWGSFGLLWGWQVQGGGRQNYCKAFTNPLGMSTLLYVAA